MRVHRCSHLTCGKNAIKHIPQDVTLKDPLHLKMFSSKRTPGKLNLVPHKYESQSLSSLQTLLPPVYECAVLLNTSLWEKSTLKQFLPTAQGAHSRTYRNLTF